MKEKILVFIMGLLVGAIITAVGFTIYQKTNGKNNIQNTNNRPQMMQDGNFKGGKGMKGNRGKQIDSNSTTTDSNSTDNSQNTNKPEKPSDDAGTPPEIPDSNKDSSNT